GRSMTYAELTQVWERHWDFLEKSSYAAQAPIFIGEFGTCGTRKCVQDSTSGSQGLWFQFFMKYLTQHPEIGWSFWALNGTNTEGHDQPNYVLASDWKTPRNRLLIETLRDVEVAPPPV
ncbi:MAG TPA: hypothetical protein VF898_04435, partial [Chloroflexota bacterium]